METLASFNAGALIQNIADKLIEIDKGWMSGDLPKPDFMEDRAFQGRVFPSLQPNPGDRKHGYLIENVGTVTRPYFISTSDTVNELLLKGEWDPLIRMTDDAGYYQSLLRQIAANGDANVSELVRLVREKLHTQLPLVNEPKISLYDDFHPGRDALDCKKTSYFATILTVDKALEDIELESEGERRTISAAKDRYPAYESDGDFVLKPISHCRKLSMQLGVNTLFLTSDGYLVLSMQGRDALKHAYQLMPSSSGSLDWEDGRAELPLSELALNGALRETREEQGQNEDKVAKDELLNFETDLFQIIGFSRGVKRAGKPDLFAFARVDWPLEALRRSRAELLAHKPGATDLDREAIEIHDVEALRDWVSKRRNNAEFLDKCSVSLLALLKCLETGLERAPEQFEKFFR